MRILVFMCVLLSAVGSYAQSGWYIKAVGGVGSSNIKAKTFTVNGISIPFDYQNIVSYDAGVNVGYRIWNVDISMGAQFLSTGQRSGISFGGSVGFYDSGFLAIRFRHILIPLNLGYQFRITKRLSIVPQAGVAYSLNLNRSSHLKTNQQDTRDHTSSDLFTTYYKRSTLFSAAHLNIEYALSNRISVCVAPSYYYMLSSFDNPPAYANFDPMEHPYAWCVDAGVVWRLKRKTTLPPTPAQ